MQKENLEVLQTLLEVDNQKALREQMGKNYIARGHLAPSADFQTTQLQVLKGVLNLEIGILSQF